MYLESIFISHHVFHGVTYRCRGGHCEVKIFILTAARKGELQPCRVTCYLGKLLVGQKVGREKREESLCCAFSRRMGQATGEGVDMFSSNNFLGLWDLGTLQNWTSKGCPSLRAHQRK